MLSYLDDVLNEYNIFADVIDSSFLCDVISPFEASDDSDSNLHPLSEESDVFTS